jgi:cold shock CspA family protein
VQASYDAICAYDLAADELDKGAADKRLRDTACQAATAAIRYLMACQEFDHDVDTMPDFFDKVTTRISQLSGAEGWQGLIKTVMRYQSSGNVPYAITRLVKAVDTVDSTGHGEAIGVVSISAIGSERHVGSIFSLRGGYGFIESPTYTERVYFHKTGLMGGVYFSSLRIGMPVVFSIMPESGGRLRAEEVEVISAS